jgi:hypothetical protein
MTATPEDILEKSRCPGVEDLERMLLRAHQEIQDLRYELSDALEECKELQQEVNSYKYDYRD